MKKPKHYIKQDGIATFCCTLCGTYLFRASVVDLNLVLHCTVCNVFSVYPFANLANGSLAPFALNQPLEAPQQEPAVQVPATAPAVGHLSTEPVDK